MSSPPIQTPCEMCGATDRDEQGVCRVCGASPAAAQGQAAPPPQQQQQPLAPVPEPASTTQHARRCPACQAVVDDPMVAFCAACGTPLPSQPEPARCWNPQCGQLLSDGAAFCPYCGQQAAPPAPVAPAVPVSPQVCPSPTCGQPLRDGVTFCTRCGTAATGQFAPPVAASPAAEVTPPTAPSAAPRARRPGVSQAWKRRLGICFGAIGLVLVVWAATVGVRSSGVLSFERPQTSPTTLAGDEADIWAELDAVKAERDAELQRRFDETTNPES